MKTSNVNADHNQAIIRGWVGGTNLASTGTLPWTNVTDSGAVGDGVTDNLTAINDAIAGINAAGCGVLYFPCGTYVVSGALDALTVPCTVMGDGMYGVSIIACTSQTAALFTTSVGGVNFRDLEMDNTYAGTASAGAAIVATNTTLNTYDHLYIHDFYTGIDIEDSLVWKMTGCHIGNVKKYGVRIRNTAVPDGGDWFISDSWFGSVNAADAGIRIETSGGGKIVNVKINGDTGTNNFDYGIDLAVAASTTDTSILLISNCSIENVSEGGIRGTTGSATSKWGNIEIANCQFSILGNSAKAITLVATTASDFYNVIIAGCEFGTAGTARSAIQLTKCDNVILTALVLYSNFTSYFTNTTSTNVRDYTGGVAAGVTITGTPSSGQVPTATGASAATWQTPSAASSEYDYAEDTSGTITISATSDATATTIVTGNAVAYPGSVAVMIHCFVPDAQAPSAANSFMVFNLYEDGSDIGRIAFLLSVDTTPDRVPISGFRRITPSAGTHTYSFRAWVDAGTSVVNDSTGGAATRVPAFIRVTRA